MKKILIGIPSIRKDQCFIDSMDNFIPKLSDKYNIDTNIVKNKPIDIARNEIVNFFLINDYDYLLFLDDDHSGHTLEMLEALLKPDEMVCAIKCYSRFFPYLPNLLDYSGINHPQLRYERKNNKSGYDFCDLVGFGMTLIKREVFDKLNPPYFVAEENSKEDNYFCDELQKIGIRPLGCFDYTLTHNGINESNVKSFLNDEINKFIKENKIWQVPIPMLMLQPQQL